MTSLGERIRLVRKQLRLTQDELCTKVGISKGFLSDVENGKRNISSANLLDIAKALRVSCDFLLLGAGDQPNEADSALPASLVAFGRAQKLDLRALRALYGMFRQVLAFRASEGQSDPDGFDWAGLYQGVKGHLKP